MNKELKEGEDFYIKDNLQIFTAAYLRKRGYCCKNACTHCPFGYKKPTSHIKITKKDK